jgi:putative flippase GtrA
MAKKSKQHKVLIQFVEYMISGGAYFWVGYVILLYLNSNTVGWTVNFVLQRFWVFNNKNLNKHKTQVTGRYIFITLVDFVLNYLILLGLENIGIQPKFGQFISSAFFTGWNWFWYKLWVFPEHMKKQKTVITPARLVAHRPHGHSGYHKMYR